jgi:hypothetical protein
LPGTAVPIAANLLDALEAWRPNGWKMARRTLKIYLLT